MTGIVGEAAENGRPLSSPVLAYVLEVSKPWLPSSQVLSSIVQTLEEQQTKLSAKEDFGDQFEAVLRGVNQTLNSVSEQGETDWIGNLNGLILLLAKDELHFSQTGRCPAYLLQNNRIRQITDDGHDPDPHPLKTFSNLASGQLTAGDVILVANQELYNEISLDALRRIMNSHTPYQANIAIAKELRTEKNLRVTTLVTAVRKEKETVAEPEAIELSQFMESSAKKLYAALLPKLQAARTQGAKLGAAGVMVAKNVAKAASEAARKAAEKKAQRKTENPSEAETPQGLEAGTPSEERVVEEATSPTPVEDGVEIGSVIPAAEFALERPAKPLVQQQDDAEPAPTNRGAAIMTFLTQRLPVLLKQWLAAFLVWIQVPKNKKLTALGCAVIIVASVVWGAISARRLPAPTDQSLATNTSLLADVSALNERIGTEIELEQRNQASRLVQEAFAKLNQVSNPTGGQQQEHASLWTAITRHADTLTGTLRLSNPVAYEFTKESAGFVTSFPYFYGFETAGTSVLRTGSGTLSTIQDTIPVPDSGEAILAASRSAEPDTAGYVLTRQAAIYRIVQSGTTTLLRRIRPAEGDFAPADAIATYSGNVYLLDGKAGMLWRYRGTGTAYEKGSMIIDVNRINLKGGISLAIDGSVYILKQDGSVVKTTGGRLDETFTLKNQPLLSEKLIRPLQIVTNESMNSIYLLDGGTTSGDHSTAKVMEFDKNGAFIRQYAFPANMTNVHAFDINPKEKKLWLLNGRTVYEFGI